MASKTKSLRFVRVTKACSTHKSSQVQTVMINKSDIRVCLSMLHFYVLDKKERDCLLPGCNDWYESNLTGGFKPSEPVLSAIFGVFVMTKLFGTLQRISCSTLSDVLSTTTSFLSTLNDANRLVSMIFRRVMLSPNSSSSS